MLFKTGKVTIMIIILLFIAFNLWAGWALTYGGAESDWGNSVQQTTDGGYIIVGGTTSFGSGDADVYMIKTLSNGDTLWTRTYGGSDTDEGNSVQQTSDGGYIITGETKSYGAGSYYVYLIKTDNNGDTLWTQTFGSTGIDKGNSVQQTSDGGYIITGTTSSYGAGLDDVYLIKTDINGDSLWTRVYGGAESDIGHSVQQTTDGGYIITGRTISYGAGASDVYLIKTASNGDSIWTRTFGGATGDAGYSVQQTIDGGYIIAGRTSIFNSLDVYLIKTTSTGDSIWTQVFGGSMKTDEGHSVQQTIDGGYIVVGETWSYGSGETDIYLIKTTSTGDSLWTQVYGGADYDRGYSVQQTSDNGYIITGHTQSFGPGDTDVYLIKTDVNGVAVEETIISTPNNFSYSINNISNNNIALQFSLKESCNLEFNIYDASGRYVSTPIIGNYQAGVYNVNFTTDVKGIYFFNLTTNKFSENGKFIVI